MSDSKNNSYISINSMVKKEMVDEPLKTRLKLFKTLIKDLKATDGKNTFSEIIPKVYHAVIKLKAASSINVLPPRILLDACEKLADVAQMNKKEVSKECILNSCLASVVILNILTSPGIDPYVYSEEIIDKVLTLISNQLHIYFGGVDTKEEGNNMCNKIMESLLLEVNLLIELVNSHHLVECQIQRTINIGLYSFQNGLSQLNITGIRLLSVVFSKYENYQLSILSDVHEFAVKFSYHNEHTTFFSIGASKKISLFCVLIMSLLQSASVLPEVLGRKQLKITENAESLELKRATCIVSKQYSNIIKYSQLVTYDFLSKCMNENSCHDRYNKKAFSDFLHDLFCVMLEPEWPISVTLLYSISQHLVNFLQNANFNVKFHIHCMGWLSDTLVKFKECDLKAEKSNESFADIIARVHDNIMTSSNESRSFVTMHQVTRHQYLQSIFIQSIAGRLKSSQQVVPIENYYIIMWINDLTQQEKIVSKTASLKEKKMSSGDNKENEPPTKKRDTIQKKYFKKSSKKQLIQLSEPMSFFMKYLYLCNDMPLMLQHWDIKSILCFFISSGEYMKHFSIFLFHIGNMLKQPQPSIRAKAMQCLRHLLDVDIKLVEKQFIQFVAQHSLCDKCISVREIAIDIIGRCMYHIPEKCEHYFQFVIPYLLDKGVSVRKQALKILRDVTTLYPNLPNISEFYLKMLECIEDPVLKPVIVEVLKNKWFTPKNNSDKMNDQIRDLNTVVERGGTPTLQCLKILVEELCDSHETIKKCEQFVNCIVNYLLEHEVNKSINVLCYCLQILNAIAQVKPEILVAYISTLEPYLSLHQQEDERIILSVTRILKQTIPLLENPADTFLSTLEEDLSKLLFVHKHCIVESTVPCLVIIVKKVTHNDKLVAECFDLVFGAIKKFASNTYDFSDNSLSRVNYIQRCLLISGLVLKYYDFTDTYAQDYFNNKIIEEVYITFMGLLKHQNSDIQWYTLKALGKMCCKYSKYLLNEDLKEIYSDILTSQSKRKEMKNQVLNNLIEYLKTDLSESEEKSTFQRKIMSLNDEDEDSNLRTIIITQYLTLILNCIFQESSICYAASFILKIIVQSGSILPQKIMPYLIALTTDSQSIMSEDANMILKQLEYSHPGIFDFHIKFGLSLSYNFQIIHQRTELVRGYRDIEGPSQAYLSPVYHLVQKNKHRRRNFLRILLQDFKEEQDIDKLLYLSDNLAYLPYELEDELLFVVQFINMIAATTAYKHMQRFQQHLLPKKLCSKGNCEKNKEENEEDSDNEDYENVQNIMDRMPLETKYLQKCMCSFQGCLLLLKVKHYLQETYGITNRMVELYSAEKEMDPTHLKIENPNPSTLISQDHLQVLQDIKAKKTLTNDQLTHQYLELKTHFLFENDSFFKKDDMRNNKGKKEAIQFETFKRMRTKSFEKNYKRRGKKRTCTEADSDMSTSE